MTPVRAVWGLIVLLTVMVSACAVQMPSDPHGTLAHVTDGTLRVGATENSPWVEMGANTAGEVVPMGSEPELVESFAVSLDSQVSWTVGSEAALIAALERGELDMVIGGFDDQTLWSQQAAVTVPFTETLGRDGPRRHVMLVRMGENRFLVTLEKFLLESAPS